MTISQPPILGSAAKLLAVKLLAVIQLGAAQLAPTLLAVTQPAEEDLDHVVR